MMGVALLRIRDASACLRHASSTPQVHLRTWGRRDPTRRGPALHILDKTRNCLAEQQASPSGQASRTLESSLWRMPKKCNEKVSWQRRAQECRPSRSNASRWGSGSWTRKADRICPFQERTPSAFRTGPRRTR